MHAAVAVVAERLGGRRRRRWCRGASLLLGVKLDYLELDAADALLPTGRLVLAHLADGICLLPAERARASVVEMAFVCASTASSSSEPWT
jgi:hypothetical protein